MVWCIINSQYIVLLISWLNQNLVQSTTHTKLVRFSYRKLHDEVSTQKCQQNNRCATYNSNEIIVARNTARNISFIIYEIFIKNCFGTASAKQEWRQNKQRIQMKLSRTQKRNAFNHVKVSYFHIDLFSSFLFFSINNFDRPFH